MPYIGNTIRAADDYRLIDDISSSFNGSTTSFALQVAGSAPVPFPKSPQQVLISVNGVIQEPDPSGSSGFNLVGTNIVFSSAPTNGHAFFGIIYATADYLNAGGNFPAGSLGAPSITFIGDENTGLYRKGGGSIGFVADATEIANTDSNGLTISSGNLILGDSSGTNDDRIKLGAGGDLQIFHAPENSFITESGSGNLKIQASDLILADVDGTEFFRGYNNGQVELSHNGNKKAETVSGGFTVTGVCTATSFAGDGSSLSGINTDLVSDTSPQLGGDLDANTNNILFGDSASSADDRIKFGASTDLQIFHDGNSKIQNSNNGCDLRIISDTVELKGNSADEMMLKAVVNNQVELYHNNSKKFETTSSGVTVTGNSTVSGDIHGTGTSLEVGSFGSDGSAAVKRIRMVQGGEIHFGDTTTSNFIGITEGTVNQFSDTDRIGIYYRNELKLYSNNNNARWIWESNGHYIPNSNNTVDIGSTSARVRNIYTNDLNLSNEGSTNDVDGTWGDYTIQEGYEDLFLINRRTGKKFKFNLTEVS